MKAQDVMTENPVCCLPTALLRDAAQLMCDCDCGELPVIENEQSRKLIGVITDRDICCRGVAAGLTSDAQVQQCMTRDVVAASPDTTLEECCRVMEEHQIRRLPIVDAEGMCCGIIAQADLVENMPGSEAAKMVREVSRPSGESHVHL